MCILKFKLPMILKSQFLCEDDSLRTIFHHPAIGGVAHDGQRPGSRVDRAEAINTAKRAQGCLLHHVLGI